MNFTPFIRYIARFDGMPMESQLQLHRIADRSLLHCSLDDSVRVAYVVFKMLWLAPVSH